ncbi:hypothetical protein GALMADRAFT_211696 [Galerina marginata CBS 339.88]|uniref:Uncharacterized protein n=1 Tax=Galerina marginata (strain CBS 339.88) TaxID=685588 RepID=A0A067T6S4_GALM3|nr:hypothetical protein GALMADRAFT_211696 [Galerina marginata CBS 339.88]
MLTSLVQQGSRRNPRFLDRKPMGIRRPAKRAIEVLDRAFHDIQIQIRIECLKRPPSRIAKRRSRLSRNSSSQHDYTASRLLTMQIKDTSSHSSSNGVERPALIINRSSRGFVGPAPASVPAVRSFNGGEGAPTTGNSISVSGEGVRINHSVCNGGEGALPSGNAVSASGNGINRSFVAAASNAMDTAPDTGARNANASDLHPRLSACAVRRESFNRDFYVIVALYDRPPLDAIQLAGSRFFTIRHFAEFQPALGCYTAAANYNVAGGNGVIQVTHPPASLGSAPQQSGQLRANQRPPPSSPISISSTESSPVNPGTWSQPIYVASNAPTPVLRPPPTRRTAPNLDNYFLRVPRVRNHSRAQREVTPTPALPVLRLRPFPMPAPSPTFGLSPAPAATTAPVAPTSLIANNAVLAPDSSEDSDSDSTAAGKKGKKPAHKTRAKGKGKQPAHKATAIKRKVEVFGDSSDDDIAPTPVNRYVRPFRPLFSDGYSTGDFFTSDRAPDDFASSQRQPSLIERLEPLMNMPLSELQRRSDTRRAARVSNNEMTTASTSTASTSSNQASAAIASASSNQASTSTASTSSNQPSTSATITLPLQASTSAASQSTFAALNAAIESDYDVTDFEPESLEEILRFLEADD